MHRVRKGRLPTSEKIVRETFEQLGFVPGKITPEVAQRDFTRILLEAWKETLNVLERYEREVYGECLAQELAKLRKEDFNAADLEAKQHGFASGVSLLFKRWYPYLAEIFLSISQSRKQRGGKDFELQFAMMLDLIKLPYKRIDRQYRVDFVIPSDEVFSRNRNVAMIASAKRTLRERWREVVEELHNTRSPNIFLITADSDVTPNHAKYICEHYRIHLVVWDEVKDHRFRDEPLVLGYTEWANHRIPFFKQQWSLT